MSQMISYCGLNCFECPTYIATKNDDDEAREKVANQWSKMFKFELKKEDINCDGCHVTDGRLFGHCTNCEIRNCGQEKGVENCGKCNDYLCEKLNGFLNTFNLETARKTLKQIRANLNE